MQAVVACLERSFGGGGEAKVEVVLIVEGDDCWGHVRQFFFPSVMVEVVNGSIRSKVGRNDGEVIQGRSSAAGGDLRSCQTTLGGISATRVELKEGRRGDWS